MSHYHKKQPGFLETILLSIGRGLWFLVSWPLKKIFKIKDQKSKIDKIANHRKWLEIEKLLESGDEIHAEQAVVRADKFFDTNLKLVGARGETFANRLRNYVDHFSKNTYQLIWRAHKLRNQITHDEDLKPTIDDCKSALDKFRRGLENLGAL